MIVNKQIYQQQVLMHQNIIYAPAAANGFIVGLTITALMSLLTLKRCTNLHASMGTIQHKIPIM